MFKLAKYLKPFLPALGLAIALLFGQALCDLNLPNLMSDIVNSGLQQSGVTSAAPDAISPEGMRLVTTFMTDAEKRLVGDGYALVQSADRNADGEAYASVYPGAGSELYIKKAGGTAAADGLDTAFGMAALTLKNAVQDMAAGRADAPGSVAGIDLAEVYRAQPLLDALPESVTSAARETALLTDEGLLRQSGILLARAFYGELGANVGAMQTAYILKTGLVMLIIALLGGLASVLVSLLSSRIAAGAARDLRKAVFEKIESFSNHEFDRFGPASLITRCTNDVTQIQQLLMMGIRMICYAPIMGVGGIIMAVGKSASMSWIIAAALIALVGMVMVVMAIALPKFKTVQKLVDRLNLVSRETLSGLMVIRAFGTQGHEKKRFEAVNGDLTKINLFINRVMVFMMPVMMLLMNGVSLIVIWVGAHRIAESAMQIGDMMAFMQYAAQIIMSFLMISIMFIFVPRAAVSADRIAEVLETQIRIADPPRPAAMDAGRKGLVEFRDVSFRYHDAEEDTLSHISFTAKPGQTTAIIGSTGSGKSTIASLALRFYDVTRGQVLIGGADVREISQHALRGAIGFVPQKGALLSGTIASNLRYGNQDATDGEVQDAARVAQAMEFIDELPERFGAPVAQGGANVSGGQKQRLSIARALAKKPDIFIFDDSFSALDFRTDAALRRALKAHTGDSTVIVVAQRVGTVMNAEQILVLDQGRIVGRGTHRELLKNCPAYYEIASSQLSQEELA